MQPLRAALAFATLLALPGAASAGATGVALSLVPMPAVCSGASCTNDAGVCGQNAQCIRGAVDARSRISFNGKKLLAKASLRGIETAAGTPVTTDGIPGSADDYILILHVTICDWADVIGCTPQGMLDEGVALKLDPRAGKAKLKVDVAPVLGGFPPGTALNVRGASLRLPPTSPASCPGDNTAAGLNSRLFSSSCGTGAQIGMTGILTGE